MQAQSMQTTQQATYMPAEPNKYKQAYSLSDFIATGDKFNPDKHIVYGDVRFWTGAKNTRHEPIMFF